MRREDLLADALEVAGTRVAMRPTHRAEEQAIDRTAGEASEPRVRILARQANGGAGVLRPRAARAA
jgi:hypothetical protein